MAVAGFSRDDLTLTVQDATLIVAGRVSGHAPKPEFLYHGIAGRAFERRFVLADHIEVEGAGLQNGLLHVGLNRVVPEALKLRKLPSPRPCPRPRRLRTTPGRPRRSPNIEPLQEFDR